MGTASSVYVSETPLKCFWARSTSCRCSTPAETESMVTSQGTHAQGEDPTSHLAGRRQKENRTSGQGEGRESARRTPPHGQGKHLRVEQHPSPQPQGSSCMLRLKVGPHVMRSHPHQGRDGGSLGTRPPVLLCPSGPSSSRWGLLPCGRWQMRGHKEVLLQGRDQLQVRL